MHRFRDALRRMGSLSEFAHIRSPIFFVRLCPHSCTVPAMFSLQRLLGKEDKFFSMLEASAEEARTSVQALVKLSKNLDQPVVMDDFVHSRRKDKQITQDISA